MTSITEFLLARIAEDEMVSEAASGTGYDLGYRLAVDEVEGHRSGLHIDPVRALAECEARRVAIEAAWADHMRIEGEWGACRGREELEAKNDVPEVVTAFAAVYAAHPDYREEWRP